MSERYKFVEGHAHFITFAVVGWVDVFTRREYAEFLPSSASVRARAFIIQGITLPR